MSKAAAIATQLRVSAFQALGFEGVAVADSHEALVRAEALVRSGRYAVILITSDVARDWAKSATARALTKPVVLVVPVEQEHGESETAAIRRLVERAVGMDLVGKMMKENES